jgi:hypothetical protein
VRLNPTRPVQVVDGFSVRIADGKRSDFADARFEGVIGTGQRNTDHDDGSS